MICQAVKRHFGKKKLFHRCRRNSIAESGLRIRAFCFGRMVVFGYLVKIWLLSEEKFGYLVKRNLVT